MIKRLGVIIVAIAAAIWGSETVLPSLSGLPDLKTELLLDFSEHPVAGLPWQGHINGSEFVFFDVKLKQIFRTSLSGGELFKIGRPGQGPGEYQNVQDIHIEGEKIFVLDGRGRIIVFSREGKAVREMKPPLRLTRFIDHQGDLFYMEGQSTSPEGIQERVIASWREDGDAAVLVKSQADIIMTKAFDLNGKELSGGQFALSEPVFAIFDKGFVEASGSRYRLRFFDFSGGATGTWEVTAPKPEFVGPMFKPYNSKRSAYAVRAIFPIPSGLAVVGNFYRDGRPRLDCFDREGHIRASYLIPFSWEAPTSRGQVENGYFIYFSAQEGCRIYRLISPLF